MKYFSEDKDYFNAECEHCKRVLKIKRDQANPNPSGFSLHPPGGVLCKCGTVHHNIIGTTQNLSSKKINPSPSSPRSTSVSRIRVVINFIIVVIGGGFLVACVLFIIGYEIFKPPPPPPSPEEIAAKQERIDSIDARTWAKIYVKNSLKAPTTAKFQDEFDFGVAPAKDKKGKTLKNVWEVSGYVDAQNSFGAMLRNQFYIKLVKMDDGKWIPTKIVIR